MFHTRTPTHCSRPVLHPEDSSFQTLKWEDRQTQTGCRQEKEKLWRQLLSVNNDIVSIVVVFFFFGSVVISPSSSWLSFFIFFPPFSISRCVAHSTDRAVVPGGDRPEKTETARLQRDRGVVIVHSFLDPGPTSTMSRRRSTGDLVPRDITEILAKEARAQRGKKKPGSSLGQAFSWMKGSKKKKNSDSGVNRTGAAASVAKVGPQNPDSAKSKWITALHHNTRGRFRHLK